MNRHKLTQRNLEIDTRAKIQILLFVIFIPLLAITGRAQEPEEQAKDEDRRQSAQRFAVAGIGNHSGSLWTRTIKSEEPSSGDASPQPGSDRSNFAVFANAGVAVPHGDFSIFFDPGFSLNTGLEYMITSQFSVEGTLGYHQFGRFFGGHTSLYQVSGNGKFYLVDESSKLRPFINGGVGLYVTDSATTHFGGNIGGGVLYELTPRFGLQGAYNFHAVSAGFGLRFSTVQGGVRWRF
jgi:opacity protein-like surface antigen